MDTLKVFWLCFFLLAACGEHRSKSQFYQKSGDVQKPIESKDPLVLLQQALFDDDFKTFFKLLDQEKFSVDLILLTKRTLLAEATFLKKTKLIRALVSRQASLELSTIENESLLSWIEKQPERNKLLRALFQTEQQDQQDLMTTLVQNDFRKLKVILSEGVSPNFITTTGSTPLILAIENQWMGALRALFSEGATLDVNLKNSSGETPLRIARKNNLKNIETELLKRFAKE